MQSQAPFRNAICESKPAIVAGGRGQNENAQPKNTWLGASCGGVDVSAYRWVWLSACQLPSAPAAEHGALRCVGRYCG